MRAMLENVGPYEVDQLLAAGGMAEVFLGRKTGPGGFEKTLVIKRITKKLLGDREIEAMFVDEARVQALLDHANVVQVYDFGEERGSYYIAMEFVAGATLRWVIDNAVAVKRPLPLHHALRITGDVLAGLHYAHELEDGYGGHLGLIHRDISPVNVLVSRAGIAKLCDFGVAKSELQRVFTRAGIVKGKFRYMSPEQLNARPLDRRADIFSVGACLWEMLAGRRLFYHQNEDDVVAAIRSGDYPPASQFRAGMPRAIDRILRRALAADPRDRFRSARDFQLAVEEILRLLPKGSNSLLLGEYVSAELDGTAGLVRDRTSVREQESSSILASGMEALDPPVPKQPTQIVNPEETEFDESTAALPPPSALGKVAGAAIMGPSVAFAGVARTAQAVGGLFTKEKRSKEEGVKVTRTTSRD